MPDLSPDAQEALDFLRLHERSTRGTKAKHLSWGLKWIRPGEGPARGRINLYRANLALVELVQAKLVVESGTGAGISYRATSEETPEAAAVAWDEEWEPDGDRLAARLETAAEDPEVRRYDGKVSPGTFQKRVP